MAEEEKDPERLLRVGAMVKALQAATENQTVQDAQTAFANAIGLMCISVGHADPDAIFLSTQQVLLEVYEAMRLRVRSGDKPGIVPRNVN